MAINYIRVKDKATGHKFTIVASAFDPDSQQELKQDAVDHTGRPLPAEHAAPAAPAKKSSSNQSGQQATTPKENS